MLIINSLTALACDKACGTADNPCQGNNYECFDYNDGDYSQINWKDAKNIKWDEIAKDKNWEKSLSALSQKIIMRILNSISFR